MENKIGELPTIHSKSIEEFIEEVLSGQCHQIKLFISETFDHRDVCRCDEFLSPLEIWKTSVKCRCIVDNTRNVVFEVITVDHPKTTKGACPMIVLLPKIFDTLFCQVLARTETQLRSLFPGIKIVVEL